MKAAPARLAVVIIATLCRENGRSSFVGSYSKSWMRPAYARQYVLTTIIMRAHLTRCLVLPSCRTTRKTCSASAIGITSSCQTGTFDGRRRFISTLVEGKVRSGPELRSPLMPAWSLWPPNKARHIQTLWFLLIFLFFPRLHAKCKFLIFKFSKVMQQHT